MDDGTPTGSGRSASDEAHGYEPPELSCLGTVADLTQQKAVGGMDASTFLGLDLGS